MEHGDVSRRPHRQRGSHGCDRLRDGSRQLGGKKESAGRCMMGA